MTDYEKLSDRELDALVAEKVMGLTVYKNGIGMTMAKPPIQMLPHYSTNMCSAWDIVENLMDRGIDFSIDCFKRNDVKTFKVEFDDIHREFADNTPARAIAIAALKAVEG